MNAMERPVVAPDTVSLPDFLQQAGQQVGALGPEFESDRRRLGELRLRLREERCYLAVLGQFKRGKSTLVNALLGETVLPSRVHLTRSPMAQYTCHPGAAASASPWRRLSDRASP